MMLIERLGHRTDVAANGQEAVDACSKIPYALVFMDCNMPVMDGYDATKKIREAERGKSRGLEVRNQEQEIALADSQDPSPPQASLPSPCAHCGYDRQCHA
ncbi:MAG: response regulator [Nitrospirales bacterium]